MPRLSWGRTLIHFGKELEAGHSTESSNKQIREKTVEPLPAVNTPPAIKVPPQKKRDLVEPTKDPQTC